MPKSIVAALQIGALPGGKGETLEQILSYENAIVESAAALVVMANKIHARWRCSRLKKNTAISDAVMAVMTTGISGRTNTSAMVMHKICQKCVPNVNQRHQQKMPANKQRAVSGAPMPPKDHNKKLALLKISGDAQLASAGASCLANTVDSQQQPNAAAISTR